MSNPDLESKKGDSTSKASQDDDMATTIQEVQPDTTIEKKVEAPSAPAPPTFPEGGFQAWSVVIGVLFLMFATFGVAVSWGAFQAYYEQTMLKDYKSSTIAWIGSLQFSLMFMPGSVTGRLLDMGYHKIPLGLASVVLVVCAFLVAECTQYWHFVLCQGLGMGIASGFIFPPTLGLVSQWFHRRRATAFGVTASGTALGGILFPIMIRFLLPSVGFKWTARIIAFVMTFALSIGFLATRTRLPPRPVIRFFTPELYKSSKLLFYCASSFFAFLGLYAILTFLPVSAELKGINESLAFYLVSIMNGASIVGRITAGMVGDRVGPLNIMIPMTLIAAGVTFAWPYAHNVAGFVLVAIFYGLAFGAFVGLLPSPAAALGPLHTIGERIGVQLTIMSIAILVGSPIAGAIRADPLGFRGTAAYAGSFIVLSVIFMVFTKRAATGHWIKGKF